MTNVLFDSLIILFGLTALADDKLFVFCETLKVIMDLMSSVRSCSNNTTLSVDDDLNNWDEQDGFKELAAYYNQIIRNSKIIQGKQTKQYQARLDGHCNKTNPTNPSNTKRPDNSLNSKKRNLIINDRNEKDPRSTTNRKLPQHQQQSVHSFETQAASSDHMTCSTNLPRIGVEPKLTFVKPNNKWESHHNTEQAAGLSYAEKTTYCRPAIDMYSQEFIYKTMQRNARLKGLVRKLVLAREREKQKVAWNNYINELKNKHQYQNPELRTIPNYMREDTNPDIEDYYNTRFTWKQSNPCQNLLQDFYSASNEMNADNDKAFHTNRPFNFRPYIYDNSRCCFPTSSQGRLMMLNRERPKYQSNNRSTSRYHGIPIFVEKENDYPSTSKPSFKRTQPIKLLDFKKYNTIKSLAVQTDFNEFENSANNEYNADKTFKDKYSKVTSNVERLKQKIMQTQNEVKYCTLATIDNKLDVLIQSINSFIIEIKSQKHSTETKSEAVRCQLSNDSTPINTTKSDTFGILQREQIICGMVQERPRSTLAFNEGKRRETIDKILYEEMHKSNKVKKDIEDILSKPSRDRPSVHITFDIPTKERATEITDSLFKTRHSRVIVEEIGGQENRMTIAVNTDPLGLLALFRVSAETVKQILSYMPHIDYYSYLSRLPLPQMSRNEMSHYVCNICGAAFDRPSQLSDHIQQHNLGNVR